MTHPEPLDVEKVDADLLGRLTAEQYDALPFGAIELDRDGKVVSYNATEARFSRRTAENTVGRDFFEDVAPCTNITDFRGRIQEMYDSGENTISFDFRFKFPWGERDVRIRVLARDDGGCWVFVTDFAGAPGTIAGGTSRETGSVTPQPEV